MESKSGDPIGNGGPNRLLLLVRSRFVRFLRISWSQNLEFKIQINDSNGFLPRWRGRRPKEFYHPSIIRRRLKGRKEASGRQPIPFPFRISGVFRPRQKLPHPWPSESEATSEGREELGSCGLSDRGTIPQSRKNGSVPGPPSAKEPDPVPSHESG